MTFILMTRENALVFIDGAYLSVIAKHFFNNKPPSYDIQKLAANIAKEQGLLCRHTFYYTAPPYQSPRPAKGETERKASYDSFVSRLKKLRNFTVREGRCQKTDKGYAQKGVDTLIIMDLMEAPKWKGVKRIIIITCDTDFVPVLNKIREDYKIKVVLYHYSDRVRRSKFSMSNHLLTACDKSVLVDKSVFEKSAFEG